MVRNLGSLEDMRADFSLQPTASKKLGTSITQLQGKEFCQNLERAWKFILSPVQPVDEKCMQPGLVRS
jgi:hypothetical protein